MLESVLLSLIEALKQLSYFGVILALTFEFVPAELVLPLVGYWVYQGDMNLYLAILAGTVGGVCGPLTLYALGRYGGRPLVLKYGKYFLVKEKEIDAADRFLISTALGSLFWTVYSRSAHGYLFSVRDGKNERMAVFYLHICCDASSNGYLRIFRI